MSKAIDKKYPLMPFENEDGLSTFDLNLINRNRKRYVRTLKRKDQLKSPEDLLELLEGWASEMRASTIRVKLPHLVMYDP